MPNNSADSCFAGVDCILRTGLNPTAEVIAARPSFTGEFTYAVNIAAGESGATGIIEADRAAILTATR